MTKICVSGRPTFLPVLLIFFAVSAPAADKNLEDRFAFSGDFRLRYEGIDEDFEAQRRRVRFRARLGFTAEVGDEVSVVVRLATGGDNPVSSNQTFGDGFSSKDLSLDLAYIDWSINDHMRLQAGKIKNPMFRAGSAPLIWDGDLNPEGIALKFKQGGFFATVGAFSVEERSSSDDSLLLISQAGLRWPLSDIATLTAGAGYFAYTNTRGEAAFFNGKAKGNIVDLNGNYIHAYRNIELFAEIATEVGGWPLKLFVQTVRNTAVDQQDGGVAFGAKLGSAKHVGEVEFAWTYQDIEADAVVGTFNDSDFGGGGTDAEGHLIKAKFAIRSKIFAAATLFINEVDRFQGARHDYNRVQIDIGFKFN